MASGIVHAPPSAESASALVRSEPGSLGRVAVHFLGRAAIVGLGLHVAGCPRAELVRYSLAGAASIELFLLAWAARGEALARASGAHSCARCR